MRFTREFYIPSSSTKVADKLSDAVAYLFEHLKGAPSAAVFWGKGAKPIQRYRYGSEAERAKHVAKAFAARRAQLARKAESRTEANAFRHTFKVGDILDTCWGYDQTNREFFEVVATTEKTVTVREIARVSKEHAWCQGIAVPQPGNYVGKPIQRRVSPYGSIRIDKVRLASRSATDTVAGMKVVKPVNWTSYA